MIINPDVIDIIDEFETFSMFAEHLLTGQAVRRAGEDQLKEFITDFGDADLIMLQFMEEVDFTAAEAAVRAELREAAITPESNDLFDEALTLGLVNHVLGKHCEDLYPKIKNKLTPENETESVTEILIDIAYEKARGAERG